jgi:site-specific recombinase XerD
LLSPESQPVKEALMGRPTGAHVCEPLRPLVHGFLTELIEAGYSWTAQRSRLRLMAELSCWMAARGLGPGDLTQPLVEGFVGEVRSLCPRERWCSRSSERQLLAYLRGLGVVPEPGVPVLSDPVDRVLAEFAEYLVRERGLAAGSSTVRDYRRVARLFLTGRVGVDGDVDQLTAGDVAGFVLAECRRLGSARSGKLIVTVLRGLLRFLYLEGLTASDLTGAVPLVAGWRGASLPKALDPEHVRRILASCDRSTSTGRRDFAILLLLARLGLRSGEVAAIQLGDVDWRAGEIVIRGKDDRHERLPLPRDVGEALVDYLRDGRPDRKDRHLFLKVHAPFGRLSSGTVRMVVHYGCDRAGIPRVGAHRLRHTVATEVLRAGAPLEEIASLLRHRRQATTVLYAKVDWERLRELARPWPGSMP